MKRIYILLGLLFSISITAQEKASINDFNFEDFDFSPNSIVDFILTISDKEESEILLNIIDEFFLDEELENDAISEFVTYMNSNITPSLTTSLVVDISLSDLESAEDILNQLQTNGNNYSLFDIIINSILASDDSLGTIETKLNRIYYSVFGAFSMIDLLKEIIIPQISLSLQNLNIALEFPNNWLTPVDPAIEKSRLTYHAGNLNFIRTEGRRGGKECWG